VRVNPGDFIVGDSDSVLVVPKEIAVEVLLKAEDIWAREEGSRKDFAAGMSFETFDRIGIDTVYNVLKYYEDAVSPDFAPAEILTNLVNEGRLGRKVGKGYYEWDENGPIKNLPSLEPKTKEFLRGHLDAELFMAMSLNEACKLLEEGVIKSYDIITKVLMKGDFTEGPFIHGKEKYKEWSEKLLKIAGKTGISYLKPCEMMKSGRFFTYK